MSGPITHNGQWTFSVCGKHPTVADYVALGDNTPWLSAMSRTVASAYSSFLARGHPPDDLMPWNFWIALEQKDGLACGRLIPSRDRVNRPYPLLIMGQGSMRGWTTFWQRLPLAMESTWNGMIGLTKLHQDHSLDALVDHLAILPTPDGYWMADQDAINECREIGSETGRFFHEDGVVRLEIKGGSEWGKVVGEMAELLKINGSGQKPPRAMFIHRGQEATNSRLFYRPVTPSDVLDMWRPSGRNRSYGSN